MMKYRLRFLLTWVMLSVSSVVASVQARGELTWFDGKHPITFSVPQDCSKVLQVAVGMFCDDMLQVTGLMPEASHKATIVVTEGHGETDGFTITNTGKQILVQGDTPARNSRRRALSRRAAGGAGLRAVRAR